MPVLLAAHIAARIRLGTIGMDFAIVAQVVDGVSRRVELASSLIGGGWRPFLLHHFTPAFYVLGLPGFAGVSAPTTLIAANALLLLVTLWCIYLYAQDRGLGPVVGIVSAGLFALNPTIRTSFAWSFHDEHLALAALAAAYVFHARRQWVAFALSLSAVAMCKESLLLVAAIFGGLAAWEAEGRARLALLALATIFFCGFAAYFFFHPLLFGKAFDHLSKLPTAGEWFSWRPLIGKLGWTALLLTPVLFLPLVRPNRNVARIIAPVLPLLGLVWASGFDQMWRPLNYYAVLPSLAFTIAAVSVIRPLDLRPATAALIVAVAFSFSHVRPAFTIRRALRTPERASLHVIARELVVAGTPAALIQMLHTREPRLVGDREQTADLIIREDERPAVGTPCHPELTGWYVHCR